MTLDLFILCLVVASLLWAAVLVRETVRYSFIRDMKRLAITEETRNRFGKIRTRLVHAVIESNGRVDDIPILVTVYSLCTGLMRNPNVYDEATAAFLSMNHTPRRPRRMPGRDLTAEERSIVSETILALDKMCRDYNRAYAFGARIADSIAKGVGGIMFVKIHRRRRAAAALRTAKEQLETELALRGDALDAGSAA